MMMFSSIKDRFTKSTFLRNFSLLTISDFGSRFVSMFTNIIVARWLAPTFYGEYTLVLTYISIFLSVASLGLNQPTIRSIARNQDNSQYYFKISIILRILGFIISAIVFIIYAKLSSESFSNVVTFAILGGVLLESLWGGQQCVAFGMQRMEWNAIINLSASVLNLLIYLLLPRNLFTVNIVLGIFLFVYLLKTLSYYICLKKFNLLRHNSISNRIDFNTYIGFLKESMPFYLMFLLGLLTTQFPILFLKMNSTIQEIAYFNTANKLLLPLSIFMNTAFSAFFPNQSILFSKDRTAFCKQTKNVTMLVASMGVFLSFCISLFRHEIVFLLYGENYTNTANVLALQCWYMVMYSIFCLNGNTLAAANEQNKLAVCSVIYALVSTPILFHFSRQGADGLSKGYVVASTINLLYILPVLKKVIGKGFTWRFIISIVSIVIVSMLISIPIGSINLLYRIAVFVVLLVTAFLCRKRIAVYFKRQ